MVNLKENTFLSLFLISCRCVPSSAVGRALLLIAREVFMARIALARLPESAFHNNNVLARLGIGVFVRSIFIRGLKPMRAVTFLCDITSYVLVAGIF